MNPLFLMLIIPLLAPVVGSNASSIAPCIRYGLRKEPPKRPVQEVAPIATRLPPEKMAKAMDMTWESPCHKPTMIGDGNWDGNYTACKNGDDWGMVQLLGVPHYPSV